MIIELAVPASGNRLTHRVDRLLEATQLFVGVGQLVEISGTIRLRLGQREHGGDQANTRAMVIALASRVELAVDRQKIPHA